MVGNLPVAVVVLVLTVLRSTVAETVAEGPSSGLPSARRFDEAAVEDPIVKAQLELLKRGKINKRRLIVRLKDNPTDKAAGPSGFFDPFPDETPGGMARTTEVVVLSSEGPSSMTTTRMYSGPGFRAQSSITVKTRAFKEVERVRKKGKDNMEGFLDKKNFTDMKHYWYGARSGVSVLEVEDESMLEELWAKLSEDGGVEFVEPDMELTAFQSRRGCEPISDWGFHQTRTPQALALLGSNIAAELEDEQVLVAVIDSGVDFNHPALRDRVFVNEAELNGRDGVDDDQNGFIDDIRGWNFHDNNNDTMDFNGHGSHVAGIIAAAPNANPEFQGIAPNVKILPCKFTGKDRTGSVSDAVRCFEYAWLMGAELTSNSWGAPMAISRSLSVALDNAEQAGVLAVFAAGNDGANNDGDFLERTFPASLDHDIIISVAAINEEGNLLELSNFGDENVDIGAPGASILSTGRNGEYVRMSGTSMATPFVTGAAALLLGACKKEGMSCSPADIKSAILRGVVTTEDLRRRVSSSGHLDVSNAVQRLGLGLNVSQASSPDVIPLTQCGSAPFLSSPCYLVGVVASMLLVLLLWL